MRIASNSQGSKIPLFYTPELPAKGPLYFPSLSAGNHAPEREREGI
jgi:hypothetical protein